jgi:hypothetical protein
MCCWNVSVILYIEHRKAEMFKHNDNVFELAQTGQRKDTVTRLNIRSIRMFISLANRQIICVVREFLTVVCIDHAFLAVVRQGDSSCVYAKMAAQTYNP